MFLEVNHLFHREKRSKEERGKARALRGTGDTSLRGLREGSVVERKREKKIPQERGETQRGPQERRQEVAGHGHISPVISPVR